MEMAQFSSGWRKKFLFLNLGINCWNNPLYRVEWVNKKLINYRKLSFQKEDTVEF